MNLKKIQKLLLENIGMRQTILKNTFWLFLAEGITSFLKLILIIFIARILGATEYGKFTFALSFVGLFLFIADFGVSQILTREFSKDREKEKYFPAILSLRIFLSLVALFSMFCLSFFITKDDVIRKIIWLLALMTISHAFGELFFAFFRARQKMQYESLVRICEAILVTAIGFLVLFKFPSVINLAFTYFFAAIFASLLIIAYFQRKIMVLNLSFNFIIWKKFLQLSWPLAFVSVFSTIYNQIDSVMMGYWGQITETGWYNAAYKIIWALMVPASLISQAFLPALSNTFFRSKEKFPKVSFFYLKIMTTLALPLIVGGIILAPKIINFFYDKSFFPSVLAFQILIVMAGIFYLNSVFSHLLIVANQQKKIFWITFFAALLNIILNFIFIPRFSLYGAAFATLITFCFIFIMFLEFAIRATNFNPFNLGLLGTILISSLSSVLMGFFVTRLNIYQLNVILITLIGLTIYFLSFFIFENIIKFLSNLDKRS